MPKRRLIFAALTKEFDENGRRRKRNWMNSIAGCSASQAGLSPIPPILGRPSLMTTGVPMKRASTRSMVLMHAPKTDASH